MNTFKEKLAFGEEGEAIVVEMLTHQFQRTCLPLYQFTPRYAPVWHTPAGEVKAPDIVSITNTGRTIHAESKRKQSWVIGYNSNTSRETGIDAKLWVHYIRLVRFTRVPLELYFVQEVEDPIGIYKLTISEATLDEFAQNPNMFRFANMPERMIFFPYEKLTKVK